MSTPLSQRSCSSTEFCLCTLLKPPQFGDCKTTNKTESSFVRLADTRNAFRTDHREESKLNNLQKRLDSLAEEGILECDDMFDHGYGSTEALDCIIYYVTGYIARGITKITK